MDNIIETRDDYETQDDYYDLYISIIAKSGHLTNTTNEASEEYDNYLNDHKMNVSRAWEWMKSHLKINAGLIPTVNQLIKVHDASKDSIAEYSAYANYFNVSKDYYKSDFDYAWLHHQKNNPHHYQYWILDDDEDGPRPLEIPEPYVIEMICDWWSFSWKRGKLTEIFDWYKSHKSNIKLAPKTEELVNYYLDEIKQKLSMK